MLGIGMLRGWNRSAGGRLGALAVALWVPTVAAGLWWSQQRSAPAPSPSGRIVLELDAEQFTTLQDTMRGNVEGLDGVLRAWAAGDRQGMAAAARSVSQRRPSQATPSLRAVLPPEWSALGEVVHSELDRFADDVVAGLPETEYPARLATVTAACVTCHRTFEYRLRAD